MSAFSPRQMFLLDEACKPIREAFGSFPYLRARSLRNYVGDAPEEKA